MADETRVESFTQFVGEVEPRLRSALTAGFGPDLGREATAEALAYGWENWERVRMMENPAGYLFGVGRGKARRHRSKPPVILPPVSPGAEPWVEPGLPAALARLSVQQRTVVALLHGYEWTMSEVADVMGVSKATVQSYADRGMYKLRRTLGVKA